MTSQNNDSPQSKTIRQQQPVEAWAIKVPDGRLNKYGIGRTRKQAIESFCWDNWKLWYRRGYRCVRVRITEVQE